MRVDSSAVTAMREDGRTVAAMREDGRTVTRAMDYACVLDRKVYGAGQRALRCHKSVHTSCGVRSLQRVPFARAVEPHTMHTRRRSSPNTRLTLILTLLGHYRQETRVRLGGIWVSVIFRGEPSDIVGLVIVLELELWFVLWR